jgi:hypothetical protein
VPPAGRSGPWREHPSTGQLACLRPGQHHHRRHRRMLLTDETGPTAHNQIVGNIVANNTTSCGVTLAGHNEHGAPGGVPDPRAGGVFDNAIEHNAIFGNGLQGRPEVRECRWPRRCTAEPSTGTPSRRTSLTATATPA